MFGLSLTFLLSQLFAGIAIISDIISFQFKDRKKIIIFFMISAFTIAIHYFLLERYVAGGLLMLGIVRFFISYYSTKKYWIYIFTALFGLTTFILYKDTYDLIIFIAITFITIGVFQNDDKYLRLFMMCGTTLILIYNFFVFSPVGMLLEVIFLGSNLVGYYRHYIKKIK